MLFVPSTQNLLDLNNTARALLDALERPRGFADLTALLSDPGLDNAEVEEFVSGWLAEVCELGIVRAQAARAAIWPVSNKLTIGDFRFDLSFSDPEIAERSLAAFSLHPAHGGAGTKIWVGEVGTRCLVVTEDGTARVCNRDQAPTLLRHVILTQILRASQELALHAASLENHQGTILLCGAPGAGKSTLTLALMRHGWRFGGDDIAFISEGGRVRGLPLPVTIKEGAWPIVGANYDLSGLERLQRGDGAVLKYLPVADGGADWSAAIALVDLQRDTSSSPLFGNWDEIETLRHLFEASYAVRGQSTPGDVSGMVELVRGADCVTLSFSDADEAARALTERYGV